jgi:hypothetical protein
VSLAVEQDDGGRGSSNSGKEAVCPDQHAAVQASIGVLVGEHGGESGCWPLACVRGKEWLGSFHT